MSDPRQEFVEAMRQMLVGVERQAKSGPHRVLIGVARRACIAFVDAICEAQSKMAFSECDQRAWMISENEPTTTSEQHKKCRAALLREVGLSE